MKNRTTYWIGTVMLMVLLVSFFTIGVVLRNQIGTVLAGLFGIALVARLNQSYE